MELHLRLCRTALRSAFFWNFTQRRKVVSYRRFGRTNLIFKGQSFQALMKMEGFRETSVKIAIIRCVKSQKSSELIHTAAEPWDDAPNIFNFRYLK